MDQVKFTVEDLLNLQVVSDARISPDGDRIAYSVAENGATKGQRSPESRIWTVQLDDQQRWQTTSGPGTDRRPRWSPDGDRLCFLSDREKRGTAQVFLLDEALRETRRLTELSSGVDDFAWSPDGSNLALTSMDYAPDTDNDVRLFDADRRYLRLYQVDIESSTTTPITHGDLHVWEFCWSPDGQSIAAIVSDEPQTWAWYSARLVRIDVRTGEVTTLYQPESQIAHPAWSPDGLSIALITCRWSDPGMSGGDVILVDVESGNVRNLTDREPRSHLVAHWLPDGEGLVTIGWEHARAQVCSIDLAAGSRPLWSDDRGINDYNFTFSPGAGRLATVLSRLSETPNVWSLTLPADGQELRMERVTSHNDEVEIPEVTTRWLSWKSSDGREIEGLYITPAGQPEPGAPAMVTLIHGGPTGTSSNAFAMAGPAGWILGLLQRGIAIFQPNFRGSNGYGVEFAEANLGDLGGLDLQDVLTGIDECVRRDLADPERLGVGGWSYGGYLTAWAITQTDRFKAAVAGASITNWYSFHGGTNIPGFDSQYIGASPDELDCPYAWTSPLFACKHVMTPTLFLHGERDPVCPVGQAYEMTRSLRRRGIEVECAIYPREGHGFIEREHRRDMIDRGVGWFSTHLGVI